MRAVRHVVTCAGPPSLVYLECGHVIAGCPCLTTYDITKRQLQPLYCVRFIRVTSPCEKKRAVWRWFCQIRLRVPTWRYIGVRKRRVIGCSFRTLTDVVVIGRSASWKTIQQTDFIAHVYLTTFAANGPHARRVLFSLRSVASMNVVFVVLPCIHYI